MIGILVLLFYYENPKTIEQIIFLMHIVYIFGDYIMIAVKQECC